MGSAEIGRGMSGTIGNALTGLGMSGTMGSAEIGRGISGTIGNALTGLGMSGTMGSARVAAKEMAMLVSITAISVATSERTRRVVLFILTLHV